MSTHVFLRQRLHPGLLDALIKGGAQGIEIFGARQHFDYTSRTHVKEIADWFRSSHVAPFSMHLPLYADSEMGRGGGPGANVVHPDKGRRIAAMDEMKRALEVAEEMPLRYAVMHLGERDDQWSPRALEHAMTAIEHLQAFARPLGVKLLLENIQNEVTAPENLLDILRIGHFTDVGICLDLGHAHILSGIPATLGELKPLVFSVHVHDNHGQKDDHLWPGDGTIDWPTTMKELQTAPQSPAAVLEIHYLLETPTDELSRRAGECFNKLEL